MNNRTENYDSTVVLLPNHHCIHHANTGMTRFRSAVRLFVDDELPFLLRSLLLGVNLHPLYHSRSSSAQLLHSGFPRTRPVKLKDAHSPDKKAIAALFLPDYWRCRFKTKWLQKLIKSVSPKGIYRTKDTRRSKQSMEGKGWVCGGQLWTKWDVASFKDVHTFWRGAPLWGAAEAKYKPSYEISEVITGNITGAPWGAEPWP